MTADIELLPLPAETEGNPWIGYKLWDVRKLQDYARANVAHYIRQRDAVDPLAVLARAQEAEAEVEELRARIARQKDLIESLRVDVEAWKSSHSLLTDTCHHFQARAERLAEALRLALKWAEVLPTGEPLRAESVRDLDNCRAALEQENENG